MNPEKPRPVVLAVDDTPENLDVVKGILVPDYQVKVATNGAAALKIVHRQAPDIILLDIMMPDMDGYEVCRRLKADPATAAIPVIFLTAKDRTADEAGGFALGAADYIHKPVNPPILRARVDTHVELKRSMDEQLALGRELAAAKERMEADLQVGRDVQRSMLPTSLPARAEIELAAMMEPARELGGDFYDYFSLGDDAICFCVADVSGKGVGAALFMAMAKLAIKSSAAELQSPAQILTRVNRDLASDNPECMFVTVFLGVLDLRSGLLHYSNAGHNPPVLRTSGGELQELDERHGPLLGIDEDRDYAESSRQLSPGDTLLVYTDGVTEALNADEQFYEEHRLMQTLGEQGSGGAEQLMSAVRDSLTRFVAGAEQADDITMIAVQYKG